jgi:hypothetical protein
MNTYYFKFELPTPDRKEMKRILNGKGKIRITKRFANDLLNDYLGWCGSKLYQLKTDLSLDAVKELVDTGEDLHYVYDSIDYAGNWDCHDKK